MSDTVVKKARALIDRERMLAAGESVLVALSGGADSMTLLTVLLTLRDELSLGEVAAAHLHHGLRGAEANRDETAVRSFCAARGVRLFAEHADVAQLARQQRCGVEEAGRAARYAFFEQLANEYHFSHIATAHTRSDSMETVLLHLARGTGPGGLAGIPPVRDRLIRPLLDCTREEIEAFCVENSLPFVTDSTNADVSYARNRVRSCIVPQLYSINPRADEAFARLMRTTRADEEYWDDQIAAVLTKYRLQPAVYRAEPLTALPPALRSRVLRRIVSLDSGECMEEQTLCRAEQLLSGGGRLTLSNKTALSVKQGYFTVETTYPEFPEQPLVIGKAYTIAGQVYQTALWSPEEYEKRKKIHKILLKCAFDYDRIAGVAVIRTRRAGDAYHPFRRGGGKSLKKWMNECRVPQIRRDWLPLISDDRGILLVTELGCDHRAAITGTTQHILAFYKSKWER